MKMALKVELKRKVKMNKKRGKGEEKNLGGIGDLNERFTFHGKGNG